MILRDIHRHPVESLKYSIKTVCAGLACISRKLFVLRARRGLEMASSAALKPTRVGRHPYVAIRALLARLFDGCNFYLWFGRVRTTNCAVRIVKRRGNAAALQGQQAGSVV